MQRPPFRWIAGVLALAAAITVTAESAAQSKLPTPLTTNEGDTETARSAGMNGAARAWGSGTSAMFYNPANLAETQAYHLEGIVQLTPEAARQAYGAAIMDSITNRLAGGVSFVASFLDPDGLNRQSLDGRLGLGYPITDRFLVGIGGRYYRGTQLGVGPFGESAFSGGLSDGTTRKPFLETFTFDAGLTIRPTEGLALSVVGQNLTFMNNGVLPALLGGGIGYATNGFTIEVDGLADLNSWGRPTARVMAGAEYLIAGMVPVRAGYRYDEGAAQHVLSAGLGYTSREFGIEASVRRALEERGPTTVVIGLAYYLESSGLVKGTNPTYQSPQPGLQGAY